MLLMVVLLLHLLLLREKLSKIAVLLLLSLCLKLVRHLLLSDLWLVPLRQLRLHLTSEPFHYLTAVVVGSLYVASVHEIIGLLLLQP